MVRISFLYNNIISQEQKPVRRELISMRLKTVEEIGDVDAIPNYESWSTPHSEFNFNEIKPARQTAEKFFLLVK